MEQAKGISWGRMAGQGEKNRYHEMSMGLTSCYVSSGGHTRHTPAAFLQPAARAAAAAAAARSRDASWLVQPVLGQIRRRQRQ